MRTPIMTAAILSLTLPLGLAACGASQDAPDTAAEQTPAATETMAQTAPTDGPTQASATLATADGKDVGTVTAMQTPDGVRMMIRVTGMTPGAHGAHIHDVGTCTPDFMASGPHWAPFDTAMGLGNESEADDSKDAKITVGQDGTGTLEYTLAAPITLAGIMEGDGSSFMIHQRSDAPKMDAANGNGDRIACGVFAAATPAATGT
ncbi:superoxide dismutase family protein [Erythrobacter sp. LQ02-29]|uniref:superoxide dismutase family protein n=1 Tax=Erythrobacter sp. LQ02-29 TaxID=2920384 RepID=UPI001F4EE6CF|nr:superoxide dismutase family protein [Erythrobacter sp. LQ02-29]MCP9221696.1 superoxide dismutase family protein [Erythrobacter sp. LQ02-29]